jgi:hypothetical protein
LKALKVPLQGVLGPEFKEKVVLTKSNRRIDRRTGKVAWKGGINTLSVSSGAMVAAKPLIGGSSIVGRKRAAWQHVKAQKKQGSVGEAQEEFGVETYGLAQFRKMRETTAESTTPLSATSQQAAFRFNPHVPHSVEQHEMWHEFLPQEDDPFFGEGFSDDDDDGDKFD